MFLNKIMINPDLSLVSLSKFYEARARLKWAFREMLPFFYFKDYGWHEDNEKIFSLSLSPIPIEEDQLLKIHGHPNDMESGCMSVYSPIMHLVNKKFSKNMMLNFFLMKRGITDLHLFRKLQKSSIPQKGEMFTTFSVFLDSTPEKFEELVLKSLPN